MSDLAREVWKAGQRLNDGLDPPPNASDLFCLSGKIDALETALRERLAEAERERDERKWMEDGGTWEDRAKAAEAALEEARGVLREAADAMVAMQRAGHYVSDDLDDAIRRGDALAAALSPGAAPREGR